MCACVSVCECMRVFVRVHVCIYVYAEDRGRPASASHLCVCVCLEECTCVRWGGGGALPLCDVRPQGFALCDAILTRVRHGVFREVHVRPGALRVCSIAYV